MSRVEAKRATILETIGSLYPLPGLLELNAFLSQRRRAVFLHIGKIKHLGLNDHRLVIWLQRHTSRRLKTILRSLQCRLSQMGVVHFFAQSEEVVH